MSQLDAAVDSLISGSATQGGQTKTSNAKQASKLAAEATKLRKSQEAQRAELQNQIQASADRIATINKEKLTLEQQVKKIEAEVGPIKYVAALVYGDNPDVNTLEKAVRWMIIILVVVFDPLAVVLILAATSGLQYSGQRKKEAPLPAPEIVAEPIVEEPKKKLAEIQIQETLLPESLSEPSEFPKKSSVTKQGSKKSKSL